MGLGTKYDTSMFSGDSLTLNVAVQDGDGVAVNLTGATLEFALSKQSSSGGPKGSALFSKTPTVVNAVGGSVQVEIDPDDTADLKCGEYYGELQVTDASGNVSTVLYGTWEIVDDLIQ